jgi:hypothetical protein
MSLFAQTRNYLYERGIDPWLELASFGVLLMRVAWIVPVYRLLVVEVNNVFWLQALVVLFLFAVIVYSTVKILAINGVRRGQAQLVSFVLLVMLIPLSFNLLLLPHEVISWADAFEVPLDELSGARNVIPDESVILVTVLFVWYSAFVLARQGIGTQRILDFFSRGVVIFVLFAVFTGDYSLSEFALYLGIFIFSGLLALKTARMGAMHRFRNASAIPFTLAWLGELGGVILIVALVSLGVGLLAAGPLGKLLFGLLTWTLYGLAIILISPFIWLATPVLGYFKQMYIEGDGPMWTQRIPNVGGPSSADMLQGVKPDPLLKTATLDPLSWAILAGIVVLIVGVVLWRLRDEGLRVRAGMPDFQASDQAGLFENIRAAIVGGVRDAWARVRGETFRYADQLRAAQKVRRLYAQFLDLCVDLNVPRPEAETPLEFITRAAGTLTGLIDELDILTQAYLKVRYGGLPESEEELHKVEIAWTSIESFGKGILKERKK